MKRVDIYGLFLCVYICFSQLSVQISEVPVSSSEHIEELLSGCCKVLKFRCLKKVHGHSEAFLQHFSEALWKTKTQKIPLIALPEFLKQQRQAAVRAYSRFRTQFSTNGTLFSPSC